MGCSGNWQMLFSTQQARRAEHQYAVPHLGITIVYNHIFNLKQEAMTKTIVIPLSF